LQTIEARRESNRKYYRKQIANGKRHYYLASNRKVVKRYREFVCWIKEGVPCGDCGKYYPAPCMDFDHVRGEKLGDVSRLLSRVSLHLIAEELLKCELVCANCHRLRTVRRARGRKDAIETR
jgi:hypothetical protein